ncbi:MAG: hypothetical protein ACLSTV_01200 [Coriobacteriales bacterium]|jgi:hypothetical protein
MKNATEQKKQKAIELMKKLEIYEPYIKDFEEKNLVCYFEHFAGFWTYQNPELEKKIKEIEKEYNCTVYAVTHEFIDAGDMYSLLIVTDYKEEWNHLLNGKDRKFYAFSYVWNKSDDWCSEFGTVGVQCYGGGISRFA